MKLDGRTKGVAMSRVKVSLKKYEEAERQLLLAQRMKRWRRHGIVYAFVGTALLLLDVRSGGPWLTDVLLLLGWAVVLLLHYRWAREYGDVHVREQQIRAEWRAGRSNEELVPK
jgi:hypothetical protein